MASPDLLLSASPKFHLVSCSFHTSGYIACGWRQRHVESHVSPLRLKVRPRKINNCNYITHASSTEGQIQDSERSQPISLSDTIGKNYLEPLQRFPWDKFSERLTEHVVEAVWIIGKWFLVPVLVVSAVREVLFAISMGKELFIPLGLLGGTMMSGVLRDTTLSLGTTDFQGGELPFHIIFLMGLLFGLLKVVSYKCPILWVQVFLFQFSNAGLWQTMRFANWRRNLKQAPAIEKIM